MVMALVPMLMTTGCKKDAETTEYETLTDYAASNSLDLSDVLTGWVKGGTGIGVNADDGYSVPDYYVMDFRKAADYDLGHIKDAVNVAFGDILVEAEKAAGKKILCVCYSGQTAARATGILKMSGYDAASLKWGMSAWHADFAGKWNTNAVDFVSPNWVTTGDPVAISEFSDPSFTTGETEGADILKERINAAIALPWTVSKTDVLSNPGNYFVNNKWPQASWDSYGHVSGAYRIDEDLHLDGLKNLNSGEDLVTYCYTGQTSAITTAWLHVMGFDKAKSLLYGANGITHTKLVNGSAAAKSWKGTGSASELNFGYYDKDGNFTAPN